MIKKLGFWRRSIKVIKALADFLFTYIFIILVMFFSACLFLGFIKIFDLEISLKSSEFAKYLTTLAFTLAGFTFLGSTLIKRKEDKITQTELDVLGVSYTFILSGFFGLLFIGLSYLPESLFGKPVQYYAFLKNMVFPLSILLSMTFFLGSLIYLIIVLRIKIPKLNKKFVEDNPKKRPWKEFLRELTGFD